MEIEKKYLVKYIPEELNKIEGSFIDQYYIMLEGKAEARIRLKNMKGNVKYYLTLKCGEGMVRTEVETEITKTQFYDLAKTTTRKVLKTRLVTKEGYEVDIYHGDLTGLVTVEKEFNTIEEANSFTPPSWFGLDVTEDKRYKNRALAVNGLPK